MLYKLAPRVFCVYKTTRVRVARVCRVADNLGSSCVASPGGRLFGEA